VVGAVPKEVPAVPSPFEAEFARAWDAPGHSRYQLRDIDINQVLAARYTTSKPLSFTRAMLWDMETRKAAHPGTYIPYVVQAGTDRSWNGHPGDGGDYLDRCSMQRQWLDSRRYQLILERAFLTKAIDERLTAVFEHMAADPWLLEHTEICIRHNLGIELTRN
jgi:hypothetical protein